MMKLRKLLVNRMVSSSLPPPVKHIPLSHCLPQHTYSPPQTIQVSPKPVSPSAPPLISVLVPAPPMEIHPPHPNFCSNSPTTLPKNQLPSISPENKPACKFYMQGKCQNGRKGTNCSFPHPNMCFCLIRSGNKGCSKGSSCQYSHPKLCKASLTSKMCDRHNIYYYHVAGPSAL